MGNGYRRIYKDTSEREKIVIQCARCESAGEVEDEDFNYDIVVLTLTSCSKIQIGDFEWDPKTAMMRATFGVSK